MCVCIARVDGVLYDDEFEWLCVLKWYKELPVLLCCWDVDIVHL